MAALKKSGLFPPQITLICVVMGLCMAFFASLTWGKTSTSLVDVIDSFFQYEPDNIVHIIVQTDRLARTLVAVLCGGALALAGVLVQVLTRNPIASPAILGVNSGALFFIVMAVSVWAVSAMSQLILLALIGGIVASALVYLLGFSVQQSPIKLVLAGAAITALFTAFTQAMLISSSQNMESVLFWLAGSVANRSLDVAYSLVPLITGAFVLALALSPQVNLLLMDDDVARGLGQHIIAIKLVLALLAVVLASSAVALGGLIGFIGLIVPHVSRKLFGLDHRWVLPGSAVLGALLLLSADIVSRFLIQPQELPVGVMTALIGTPFFIYLARKGGTLA